MWRMEGKLILPVGNPRVCKQSPFTLLSLTILLEDAGDPIDPDHTQVLHDTSGQNAVGENQPNWKSTVSAAAKLLLRTVRDSADVFPPLKSVAGGICSVLDNYEV